MVKPTGLSSSSDVGTVQRPSCVNGYYEPISEPVSPMDYVAVSSNEVSPACDNNNISMVIFFAEEMDGCLLETMAPSAEETSISRGDVQAMDWDLSSIEGVGEGSPPQ